MLESNEESATSENVPTPGKPASEKSKQPVYVPPTPDEHKTFRAILRKLGVEGKKFDDKYIKKVVVANAEGVSYEEVTSFIRDNLNNAMKVAVYLCHVKRLKLYKLKYNTFEEYVEDEFNFTKMRAYQLINAHLIANDINKELKCDVIENESQARELLRLKYLKAGEEDGATTRQERVKLIAELRGKYAGKPIPATKIAEKVKSMMPVYRNAHLGKMKVEQHQSSLDKIRKTYVEKFKKIYSYESLTDDEKAKLKQDAITALRAIANELEHSDAASANGNQK